MDPGEALRRRPQTRLRNLDQERQDRQSAAHCRPLAPWREVWTRRGGVERQAGVD